MSGGGSVGQWLEQEFSGVVEETSKIVEQQPAETNDPDPRSEVKLSTFDPFTQGLPIIYGTRRVEGKFILRETNTAGNYLYNYFALCEGTVTSISPYLKNGTALPNDTYHQWAYYLGADGGAVASAPIHGGTGSGISWFTDPPSWGSSHTMKGIAGVVCYFTYNETEMARPPITYFNVAGIGLTGNDDNPANILKDYLTNTRYGAGIASGKIDTTSFDTCRDICDEVSDSVKRFMCNIVLDPRQTILNNVKQILQTCLGQLHYINGKYVMHIDDEFSGTPVVDFDLSHIVGGVSITGDSKNNRSNQVIVTWTDPNNEYKASEVAWPDPNDDTSTYNSYLTADNNLPLIKKISVPGCTNYKQARYLAQIICKTSRQNTSVSMTVTAEGANCVPGDIVTLTLASMAWSAKEFRVTSVGISSTGGINIKMKEHYDSFYSRDTATVPSAPADITIRNPSVIANVTSLSATETLYNTREGSGVKSKVTLAWTDINDNFLDAYEVSFKLASASVYEPVGDTVQASIDIFDIGVGTYDFKVVSRAIEGALSSGSSVTLATTGLDAVPSKVENFFVNSMGTVAVAQWDVSTDMDVRQGGYYVIAHSVDTSANTWDECIPITPQVAGQQTSVIVPLLAGAYAIRATDSSGQKGIPTFFQADGTSLQPLTVVGNATEDPAFSGTKNKVEAPDSILKIVSESDLDDISDVDAIVQWDALSGIYNTSSSGYSSDKPLYTFSNQLDLGSSQRVRLRRYLKVYSSVWSDLIDNRATYMDTWTDFDDTDAGVTSVKMQMRATTDDPSSGSASWGVWSDFYVEELTKRGFQFRVFPETTDSDYNINIQECRVYAEQLSS